MALLHRLYLLFTISVFGIVAFPLPAPVSSANISSYPLASAESGLESALQGLESDGLTLAGYAKAVVNILEEIVPTSTPTSIPQAFSALSSLVAVGPTAIPDYAAGLLLNGLSPTDIDTTLKAYADGLASPRQTTNPSPGKAIYPQKAPDLRSALLIPPTFQYGAGTKQPVILVPGTGTPVQINYAGNYAKLFANHPLVDPVQVSIPGYTLDDIQLTAEYVAYAINYISSVSSNKNISIISWSQGSIDTQWALKYWPSTRSIVSDFIPFSPDFHGTLFSNAQCPDFPNLPCAMAPRQQRTDSKLVATLISNNGDSAYVPTTTIYSIFDEIVQPQQGTSASGFIHDLRAVGVSNNELQALCPGLPAGGIYTHEGVLYNPVGYALVIDALTHEGPGRATRVDLPVECLKPVTDGLGLADVLSTEGIIPVAAVLIASHVPQTLGEPAIMEYAA